MERISYQDIPNGMFDKLMDLENFINDSSLDMNLLELVRVRVSQLNGCAYCVDMHHKLLMHSGETELRASSLVVWENTPYFTNKEKAVLKFTDCLTQMPSNVFPSKVYDPLLEHFSKEEISILTLAISQIGTWTRLMKVFKFEPGKFKVQVTS